MAFSIMVGAAASINTKEVLVRSVEIDPLNIPNRYTGCFATSELTTNDDASKVTLVATAKHSANDILFDNVDLVVVDNDDLSLADEAPNEDEEIEYQCTFDMNELVFDFEAKLIDEDGTVLETETIQTDAIVTENGGLDACIVVDGHEYMMSDYENVSSIDNCGFTSIPDVIATYLITAEKAEIERAKQNYTYNVKLEAAGKGVGTNRLIYDQHDTTTQHYKAGNYRFGFTTFGGVGCEVAAAYNATLALGQKDRLSTTILMFEALLIEFSVGWGLLGSNPLEISRYLKARGLKYTAYTSWNSFNKAVSGKKNCHIIMSRWNKNPLTYGLHTFYVKKEAASSLYGYNWNPKYKTKRSDKQTKLSAFNDGSGFIVGYIVWK
ncbi:MAG: hypothetical protein IKI63_03250 [Clostridia bacterium]|nr:hypothetical protein [Clostridia bacterium]